MKYFLLILILSLSSICTPTYSQSSEENQKIRLYFKWFHKFQFAGYYAATEKGYYEEEGLQVELIERNPRFFPADALIENKADYAITDSNIITNYNSGMNVVILASIFQHSPLVLIARKDSNTMTPDDLRGKRIMFGKDDKAPIVATLKEFHISDSDYTYIPHSFHDNDLIEGKVDVISGYITNQPFYFRNLGIEVSIINPLNYGIDFYGDNLVTLKQTIEKDPDKTEKFLRASLKGWTYALQNKEELIQLIHEKYAPNFTIEQLRYEATEMDKLINLNYVQIGHTNPDRLQRILNSYVFNDLIPKNPRDLKGIIYNPDDYRKTPLYLIVIMTVSPILVILVGFIINRILKDSKKLVKLSELRIKQLGNNLQDGAIFQMRRSKHGSIYFSYISKGIEAITGIATEEILANYKILYSIVHPEDLPLMVRKENESFKNITPYRFTYRIKKLGGREKWLQSRAIPHQLEDGTVTWDGIILDITQLKNTEEELKKSIEVAESANRSKSIFLANMSHELRTPLNAIIGFSQILTSISTLSEKDKENVDIIAKSGEHLLNVINQILDLSKIESGKIDLSEKAFDVHKMLQDVKNLFVIKAHDKNINFLIHFNNEIPQVIISDEIKLKQVLINLINNSIKFTKVGSVEIVIFTSNETINTEQFDLNFEIRDTGMGIAPDEMDKLFNAYEQTESGKKSNEGTGLGLPISKKFIEMMGGNIRVESIIGQGSVFKFFIKTRKSNEHLEAKKEVSNQKVIGIKNAQKNYNLMIVDDNFINRQLIIKILKPLNFVITEAGDGAEALKKVTENPPDLIWMDIQMPVMDGREATRKIRTLEISKSIKIIALTANAYDEEKQEILLNGFDGFISKPFKNIDIYTALSNFLNIEFIYDENLSKDSSGKRNSHFNYRMDYFENADKDWLAKFSRSLEACNFDEMMQLVDNQTFLSPEMSEEVKLIIHDFDYEKLEGML